MPLHTGSRCARPDGGTNHAKLGTVYSSFPWSVTNTKHKCATTHTVRSTITDGSGSLEILGGVHGKRIEKQ